MRIRFKMILLTIVVIFILPIATRGALYVFKDGPPSWSKADWSSIGFLPAAKAHPEARVLVLSGRTGRWKGIFAVHSWIVLKPENATSWTRYDVVGWGSPVRINNWAPDGRWYGDTPRVVVDVRGAEAEALIPRLKSAISSYSYRNSGDYRIWPGPNSNTFVASVLRAVPEISVSLPPEAIGRDFRPFPWIGLSDSRTGVEANLWGLLGVKVGLVEGLEVNFLGLVAGVDVMSPALKIPGFGRVGFTPATAIAASAR